MSTNPPSRRRRPEVKRSFPHVLSKQFKPKKAIVAMTTINPIIIVMIPITERAFAFGEILRVTETTFFPIKG